MKWRLVTGSVLAPRLLSPADVTARAMAARQERRRSLPPARPSDFIPANTADRGQEPRPPGYAASRRVMMQSRGAQRPARQSSDCRSHCPEHAPRQMFQAQPLF